MTLMLHCGAEETDYAGLCEVKTPEPTKSHVPIAHHELVQRIRYALEFYGHSIVREDFALNQDGNQFFGVLQLASRYGDYNDMCAISNSHNRTLPIRVGYGSSVFCCDNLSLIADYTLRRKHTAKMKIMLPGLIAEMIEPLADMRETQQVVFRRYKETPISNPVVDWALMEAFRQQVINVQRIATVHQEWAEPSFGEFKPRTAFSLFNAFTTALPGKIVGNPATTQKLHVIIDGVCEVADEI